MLKKIILTAALLSSVNTHAELLSMTFTDTNALVVTKNADILAINPTSDITFKLSGGIGRKVGIEFVKNNTVITSALSETITVEDELTSGGNNFYGHTITAPKPIDGNYTVKAYIYDLNNDVVNVDAYSITVDTIAPTTTGSLRFRQRAHSTYNNYDIAPNFSSFDLLGNSDNSSSIVRAEAMARKNGDAQFSSIPAEIETNGDVNLTSYPTSILPSDGKYQLGFALYDLAGNKKIITKEYNVDTTPINVSLSGAFNPKTGLWDNYIAGMEVHENPTTFRISIPKSTHRNFSVSGTGVVNSYNSVDETNVYYEMTVSKPKSYPYKVLYTDAGMYHSIQQSRFTYILADGVDEAPEANGYVDHMTSDGVWHDTHRLKINTPTTITKIRINAAIRSYEQLGIMSNNNGNTCVIPAGSNSCELDINVTRDNGHGYRPYAVYLQSSVNGIPDGRFYIHIYYLLVYWDFVAPLIDDISTSLKIVTMNVTDTSKPNDWRNGIWNTSKFLLRATNVNSGNVIEIPQTQYEKSSYNTFIAEIDLAKLPEGIFDIIAVAEDSYGNEGTKDYANNVVIDNTAPSALLTYKNGIFSDEINGLEHITLALIDPSQPSVVSMQLTGGPTNSIVNLAWRSTAFNEYGLEYPKIFPSLIDGEDYTLTIIYSDAFNNIGSSTVSFRFIPANLVNVGVISTLAVNKNLLSQTNVPLTYIESPTLLDDNGELARGDQILDITLRIDAQFSVIIEGQVLKPGQTRTFTINISLTNGKLKIPVYPELGGIVGEASFMVNLPLIQANN